MHNKLYDNMTILSKFLITILVVAMFIITKNIYIILFTSLLSIYLMINNISWDGYATFAGYTGGGGAALQFGNKLVNSKYNSVIGSYEPKEIVEEVETREGLRKKTENNVPTGTRR